jgi:hypothetical protein
VAAPTASARCETDGSRGGRHLLPGVGRGSPRVGGQRWLTVRGHQKGTFRCVSQAASPPLRQITNRVLPDAPSRRDLTDLSRRAHGRVVKSDRPAKQNVARAARVVAP